MKTEMKCLLEQNTEVLLLDHQSSHLRRSLKKRLSAGRAGQVLKVPKVVKVPKVLQVVKVVQGVKVLRPCCRSCLARSRPAVQKDAKVDRPHLTLQAS